MGLLYGAVVYVVILISFRPLDAFLLRSGDELETYNVDTTQISVSGISSGAAMATQMHVIFSDRIMGVGLIAGVPFACAEFTAAVCMTTPSLVSASSLIATTTAGALLGNVYSTSNMDGDRVYIYNGQSDSVVNPAIGRKIALFYEHFTDDDNIKTVFDINSEHGQITNNYGAACDHLSSSSYINNCNYSSAYNLLDFIYGGNLQEPNTDAALTGQLLEFSQSDFFYLYPPSTYSMDTTGYVYVPTRCATRNIKCKLHVAFHGCEMGRAFIDEEYVRHAGYNEVADLNDMLILYPQAIAKTTNPNGCWDWFGYTGSLFATSSGYQPTALRRMITKVAGL